MKITSDNASYIGDGVYIKFDGYNYILTTHHHDEYKADNCIYLEPEVLNRLNKFVDEINTRVKNETHE